MNLAQLIGSLRLAAGYYDDGPPQNAQSEPAVEPRKRVPVCEPIRAALKAADAPLFVREIAARTGLTALQVATNIKHVREAERTGEKGSYRYGWREVAE